MPRVALESLATKEIPVSVAPQVRLDYKDRPELQVKPVTKELLAVLVPLVVLDHLEILGVLEQLVRSHFLFYFAVTTVSYRAKKQPDRTPFTT